MPTLPLCAAQRPRLILLASLLMSVVAWADTIYRDGGVIEGHESWDGANYVILGDVTVANGGFLEMGVTGTGFSCDIYGSLTVNPGGRVQIGHRHDESVDGFRCRIHGDVWLLGARPSLIQPSYAAGFTQIVRGQLTLTSADLEVVGAHQNEHVLNVQGGQLVSEGRARIGGTRTNDKVVTTGFNIEQGGLWDGSETIVQWSSGIWVGEGTVNARGFIPGDVADAIHVLPASVVHVEDSTFDILLTLDFTHGGYEEVVWPAGQMIDWYEYHGVSGHDFVFTLKNSMVPLWWLNAVVASKGEPCATVLLTRCEKLGMHLMGDDLVNDPTNPKDFQLPVTWTPPVTATGIPEDGQERGWTPPWHGPVPAGTEWFTGNLHWVVNPATANGIDIGTWGVYPSGAGTDLTLTGPTNIAELIFTYGKVALMGTPGTRDIIAQGLFFEVGAHDQGEVAGGNPTAFLRLENVSMGRFSIDARDWRGEFKAFDGGRIDVSNTRIGMVNLWTFGQGTMGAGDGVCRVRFAGETEDDPDFNKHEEVEGSIQIDPRDCPDATPR